MTELRPTTYAVGFRRAYLCGHKALGPPGGGGSRGPGQHSAEAGHSQFLIPENSEFLKHNNNIEEVVTMSTGPKGSWSGRGPGAGRKHRRSFSEKQIRRMLRLERKYEKQYGQSIGNVLLSIIHGKVDGKTYDIKVRTRLDAIRLFYELTLEPIAESEENET